jgi:RNA polymerase sigma-70 factor (ECF subfamily)
MTRRTDEQLMLSYARASDRKAFDELYHRYAAMLRGLARARVFRADDADDIVQQTFLQVHRARAGFREGERFSSWVVTILMNLCRDQARRNRRKPEVALEIDALASHDDPREDKDAQATAKVRVDAALGTLEETIRTILVEHYYGERRLCDIANDLGLHPTTVRVRAHRACISLRAKLAEAS